MATIQELEAAMVAAHAAGDDVSAHALNGAVRTMRSTEALGGVAPEAASNWNKIGTSAAVGLNKARRAFGNSSPELAEKIKNGEAYTNTPGNFYQKQIEEIADAPRALGIGGMYGAAKLVNGLVTSPNALGANPYPKLSQATKEGADFMKGKADEAGGAAGVGEFVVDAAPYVIGGAAGALKRLPVAATAGIQALIGALTTNGDLGDRGVGATIAAAGEGVGKLLSMAGGAALKRYKPGAKALMDAGVDVPFWKRYESGNDWLKRSAESMRNMPVTGPGIRAADQASNNSWATKIVNDAKPPNLPDGAGGWIPNETHIPMDSGSVNALKGQYRQGYGSILNDQPMYLNDSFGKNWQGIVDGAKTKTPSIAADIDGLSTSTRNHLFGAPDAKGVHPVGVGDGTGFTNDAWLRAKDGLQESYLAAGQGDKRAPIGSMIDELRSLRNSNLSPDDALHLGQTNDNYGAFKAVEKTMGYKGANNAGTFTPDQYLGGLRASDRSVGKTRFAAGDMPGQRAAHEANDILGSYMPNVGPGTAPAMLYGQLLRHPTSILGELPGMMINTPTGQGLLTGSKNWQRVLRSEGQRLGTPSMVGGMNNYLQE